MVALAGQRWRRELPRHSIFSKLRANLTSRPSASDKGSGTRNLAFSLNGDLFVLDDTRCAFYTTNLRQLNSEEEEVGSQEGRTHRHQTLLCINRPRFQVCQVLLSPTQHYVALVGHGGVTVLELPQRWGKRSEFEGGRANCEGGRVNCKTVPVGAERFIGPQAVSLLQAAWYPSETEEPHLALLTSDNTITFYSLKSPQSPAKELSLSQSEEDSDVQTKCSYAASLGEIAVAFDFGPVIQKRISASDQRSKVLLYHPLYILYKNGETYFSYAHLESGMNLSKLAGPLHMYPAAEDNYGYDACAILCLPCLPNILVIATETGTLYHCVVLEVDEEDKETKAVERQTTRWSEAPPSLYVFECLELELTLKLATGEDEDAQVSHFTCPIRLHGDPLSQNRYHCTHEAGVHSVGLTWFNNLHKFLQSAEGDKNNLHELLAAEQSCVVEHILCTRPLGSIPPAPLRGFLIVSDLSLGATMICITSTYECLLFPLLNSTRPPSPPLLCSRSDAGQGGSPLRGLTRDSTEQHIRNILARSSNNPLILKAGDRDTSPQPAECLQLLSRVTQVFREEYVFKQDMAREALQRRVGLLTAQNNKQQEDVALRGEERKSLSEDAKRLADKYKDAKGRQEAITGRVRQLQVHLHRRLPVLSDSDKEMRKELQSTTDKLGALDSSIKQLHTKMEYRRKRGDVGATAAETTVSLDPQQRKDIQGWLKDQGEQIADMMKHINEFKKRISF